MKYKNSDAHYSKDKTRLKFLESRPNFKVKVTGRNWYHGKVLSLEILTWNIKALAFTVQKSLARLKFQT